MKGRKRHLPVDTEGLVLEAVVSAGDVQDRDGAALVGRAVRAFGPELPRLRVVWADGAYAAGFVEWARTELGWEVVVVTRTAEQKARKGFRVLSRRWVVERSFAWPGRFRRLAKDDESRLESSEAFIYLAMSVHMLRRLAAHTPAGST